MCINIQVLGINTFVRSYRGREGDGLKRILMCKIGVSTHLNSFLRLRLLLPCNSWRRRWRRKFEYEYKLSSYGFIFAFFNFIQFSRLGPDKARISYIRAENICNHFLAFYLILSLSTTCYLCLSSLIHQRVIEWLCLTLVTDMVPKRINRKKRSVV